MPADCRNLKVSVAYWLTDLLHVMKIAAQHDCHSSIFRLNLKYLFLPDTQSYSDLTPLLSKLTPEHGTTLKHSWFGVNDFLFFSKSLDIVGNKWQPVDSNGLAMGPQLIVSHLVENGFNVESSFFIELRIKKGFSSIRASSFFR